MPFIFTLPAALATETSILNSSVRGLGMGDALTSVASDESALFYNPAGLARVKGVNWKIIGVNAGASGASAYGKINDIKGDTSGTEFATKVNELYGEHLWVGGGGECLFSMPMFGFGVYDHISATVKINNPVYPQLKTRLINDFGYVMGVGVPLGVLHVGTAFKYIKRTGVDTTFGPSFLADLDPKAIVSAASVWGVGYGADIGASIVIPTPILSGAVSAVWKNIGGIQFVSKNKSEIPAEDNNVAVGASVTLDTPVLTITPSVDVVKLTDTKLQMSRKVNLGIEIGIPLIDIRGGFHEGYYTAGAGVNLGLFRVDAATYGVELGDYPGQIEDRRYMLQFAMQLGVGSFSAVDDGKKGKGAANKSGWGGKRLKQRR